MFTFSLSVTTKKGRELVTSFSFAVNNHDKIALIGEEGNGKSLFLKALMNHPSLGSLNVLRSISNPNLIFGYVSQEITQEDLDQTMLEFVIKDAWERYSEFTKFMHQFFPHLDAESYDRPLSSFSGGEQVKIQMMRLLIQTVDVYVFDEPTNNMDLETLIWFESWVQSLEAPVLFVSHDTYLLKRVANRILHFEQIHRKSKSLLTLYEGGYEDYLISRERQLTKHNTNVLNQEREKEKQEARWKKQYDRVSHQLQNVARQDPGLQKKMKNLKAQKRRYDNEEIHSYRDTEHPIRLDYAFKPNGNHVLFHYEKEYLGYGDRVLIKNIDLSMRASEKVACIGSNGVGKTSFVNALVQYLEESHFQVGVMHQDYRKNVEGDLSPVENCIVSGSKVEREMIASQLGNLRFTSDEMFLPLEFLSGGQKVKVSLLKILRQGPDLIILDEPTRNLSPESVAEIVDLLKGYPNAIFCITHDRDFMEVVFERIVHVTPDGFQDVTSSMSICES